MLMWLKNIFKREPKKIWILSEISIDRYRELMEIKHKCGFRSDSEMINSSLSLVDYIAANIDENNILATVNENESTYKEITLPFFEHVVRSKVK